MHHIKVFVDVVLFVLITIQLYETIIVIDELNLLNKNGVQQMLVVQHGRLVNGHLYVSKIKSVDPFIQIFYFSVRSHVEPVFDDVKFNVIKMVDLWINLNVHNQCLLNKKHVLQRVVHHVHRYDGQQDHGMR